MILVGRGTYEAGGPRLDVRLPGLEDRSPRRAILTRGDTVEGWTRLGNPEEVHALRDVNDLLVEGGSGAASAFLAADLVDRMLIYRAPILIRSEEHTSELQSLMRNSYADFCLQKKKNT